MLLLYELEQSLDQVIHTPRKQRSVKVQEPGLGSGQGPGLGLGLGQGLGPGSGSGVRSEGRGPGGLVMDHSGGNNNNPCTTHSTYGPSHNDSHDSYDTPYVNNSTSPTRLHPPMSPVRLTRSEKGQDSSLQNDSSSSSEQKGKASGGGNEASGGGNEDHGLTIGTVETPPVQRRPVSMGSGLFNSALSLLPWGYVHYFFLL